MTADYVVLANSNDSLVKRFKVIQMRTPYQRTDGIKYLLDGSIDKSAGAILKSWQYMLRVPFTVSDSNYGTLDDLKALFLLNNPTATPNDVITLTDHFGDEFDVYFQGELNPENLTTILDGVNSAYIVVISLLETNNA
jgi:hypothetical protein